MKKLKFLLNLDFSWKTEQWELNFLEIYNGNEEVGFIKEIHPGHIELVWGERETEGMLSDELLNFLRDSY